MPRQRGRQSPTLNTEENSSQGKKNKKHLPACGKPPQTSAGKHKGVRFGCSPSPSFSAVLLSMSLGLTKALRTCLGSEKCREQRAGHRHSPGQALLLWCFPERRVGTVWRGTGSSGMPGAALLCVSSTWPWGCQHTLAASLTPNLCCVGTKVSPCPSASPAGSRNLCPLSFLRPRGAGVVLGGWECHLPLPCLPHSVKYLDFSAFPLHKM